MKKLARTLVALIFTSILFSCGSLVSEIEEVSPSNAVVTVKTGGPDGGGDAEPEDE